MRTPRPRPGPPRWLRLPRRTARLRLTVLYGAAFLACGAAVLALTYLLFGHTRPALLRAAESCPVPTTQDSVPPPTSSRQVATT